MAFKAAALVSQLGCRFGPCLITAVFLAVMSVQAFALDHPGPSTDVRNATWTVHQSVASGTVAAEVPVLLLMPALGAAALLVRARLGAWLRHTK